MLRFVPSSAFAVSRSAQLIHMFWKLARRDHLFCDAILYLSSLLASSASGPISTISSVDAFLRCEESSMPDRSFRRLDYGAAN